MIASHVSCRNAPRPADEKEAVADRGLVGRLRTMPSTLEGLHVRRALFAVAALGFAGLFSTASAQCQGQGQPPQILSQWQNPHPGFLIYNSYWHPGPYG